MGHGASVMGHWLKIHDVSLPQPGDASQSDSISFDLCKPNGLTEASPGQAKHERRPGSLQPNHPER